MVAPNGSDGSEGQSGRKQAQSRQGQGKQPQNRQAQGKQGQNRQGQNRQGRPAQGRSNQGRTTQGRSTQQKAAQGKGTEGGITSGTRPARTRDLTPPPRPVARPAVAADVAAKPSRRRALVIAAVPAVILLVVVIAVGAALAPPLGALVVAIAVAAAAWAGVWFGATRLLSSRLGGSFVEDDDVPRAANLVDGLCATMGLPLPALYLIDDAFRGALVIGRNESTATLVVTTGLLRALDPVELEGVLAHELSHVKFGDMASGTMAAAIVLPIAPLFAGSAEFVRNLAGMGRELAADVRASAVTRFPPGLRDAIVKMAAGPCAEPPSPLASPGIGRVLRWQWTVVPELLSPATTIGVLDAPATRIAALDEA